MSFTNSFSRPAPEVTIGFTYGPDPYDINFVFPIPTSDHPILETPLVKLTPFIPRIHAETYLTRTAGYPELYRYYPFQFSTLDELLPWIEGFIRRDTGSILFAIIDKTKSGDVEGEEGALAGTIGLLKTSPENLTTEIGGLVVFPPFQRTHVTTHASGLLLRWLLDLPSASPPGLGLRRVQWSAHPENVGSRRVAERLGMKLEGCMRWMWALRESAEGKKGREGDTLRGRPGRDSVLYALCWDDWEGGGREVVMGLLKPRIG
ncbi:hypothetical protein JAAARDRAFT_142272 [Jaapia argillacea MUCL 33604]|uniref:N-acetyltransferase domain-containing protein n=1 Tax=Jaapia argillacea MUCL 33604 TaxID=933084 RepID=A0A067P631_9AGAM|nr:hypothetical protein JAAARDRAFT_142272 [Jaapia argillacea MUCL 33604]